jgi:hypothetical protein
MLKQINDAKVAEPKEPSETMIEGTASDVVPNLIQTFKQRQKKLKRHVTSIVQEEVLANYSDEDI